jgi:hypothetical protein
MIVAKVTLDEIALRVLQDMLISFAVEVLKLAKHVARQVPIDAAFEDPKTKQHVIYEPVPVMTSSGVVIIDKNDKPLADSSSSCQDDYPEDQQACKKLRVSLRDNSLLLLHTADERGFGHCLS